MRASRFMFMLVLGVASISYAPAYYGYWKLDTFIKQESVRAKAINALRRDLVTEAPKYGAVLTAENVQVVGERSFPHIKVDFRVPVDLYLFQHELTFQTEVPVPALARR